MTAQGKRLRIALTSRELAPFTGGGIGTYAAVMARALAKAGHDVHVVTAAHPGLSATLAPGINLHAVDVEQGAARVEAYPAYPMRHAMAVHEKLLALAAQAPFDLIEFPEFWGEGYFAFRARRHQGAYPGTRLSVRLHTPSRDVRELNRVAWWDREAACLDHLEEFCIREADLVVSPTRSLLDRVAARGLIRGRSAVHRNPWDDQLSSAVAPHPPEGAAELLYFGRIELRKGLVTLFDAATALLKEGHRLEVRCIGGDTPTGPQGQSLRRYLERRLPPALRSHFHFEEHRSRPALVAAIQRATVCCFPSLWENFPNVVLEAMSLGAPVVGSDAGGMAEIIEPGKSGWLFRAGDAASLAATLSHALGATEERRRVAAAAPERVRTLCDPETLVAELESLSAATPAREVRPVGPRERATPRVSVIIPCFNTGEFLEETVASVQAQTYKDYELVIVDDGSTEPATLEVLSRLEKSGVRRIVQENQGLSAARNAGLREARGEWVLPLDSDDLLSATFLEKTTGALEREPGLVMAASLVSYFEASPPPIARGWVPWGLERDALAAMNIASVSAALLVKDAVLSAGGYDEWMLFEDWDLYARLALAGGEAAIIPEFLFHYRMRPASIMHRMSPSRRYALQSELLQRYPALPMDASRTARLLVAELSAKERDAAGLLENPPLRYRLADALNDAAKRFGVGHRALKRALSRPGKG